MYAMSRMAILLVAMLVFLSCSITTRVLAQGTRCDSTRQFLHPNAKFYPKGSSGIDTTSWLGPGDFVTQMHFETQSDSSITRFVFEAFTSNGRRVWLNNWCDGKTWNWNDSTQQYVNELTNAQLSANTHTAYMPIIAGDTLGFYRHIYWLRRGPSTGSLAKYISDDIVSYSVELVKQTTGQRIALLDTFRISQSGVSSPCVNTWYPLASKIRYVIPSHITDTVYACIRINVRTDGATSDTFTRGDIFGTRNSKRFLNNPYFENFMTTVNTDNVCGASTGTCGMAVTNGVSGTINAAVSSTSITQVKAFSQSGYTVTTTSVTSWPSTCTLATGAGLFIVCGLNASGGILCTSTVLVP